MRIDIRTKTPVKDKDIRAVYILDYAIKNSTQRMRKANLEFVLRKYGYKICELGGNQTTKA